MHKIQTYLSDLSAAMKLKPEAPQGWDWRARAATGLDVCGYSHDHPGHSSNGKKKPPAEVKRFWEVAVPTFCWSTTWFLVTTMANYMVNFFLATSWHRCLSVGSKLLKIGIWDAFQPENLRSTLLAEDCQMVAEIVDLDDSGYVDFQVRLENCALIDVVFAAKRKTT